MQSSTQVGVTDDVQCFRDWRDSGITGVTIAGDEQAMRAMAECADLKPVKG